MKAKESVSNAPAIRPQCTGKQDDIIVANNGGQHKEEDLKDLGGRSRSGGQVADGHSRSGSGSQVRRTGMSATIPAAKLGTSKGAVRHVGGFTRDGLGCRVRRSR